MLLWRLTCSVMVGRGGILEWEGEDRSPRLLSLGAIWGHKDDMGTRIGAEMG